LLPLQFPPKISGLTSNLPKGPLFPFAFSFFRPFFAVPPRKPMPPCSPFFKANPKQPVAGTHNVLPGEYLARDAGVPWAASRPMIEAARPSTAGLNPGSAFFSVSLFVLAFYKKRSLVVLTNGHFWRSLFFFFSLCDIFLFSSFS